MSREYDEPFEELAAGYFDQTLDEAQSQRFAAMLRSDDRLVKRFAELAQLHQMIASEIAYAKQAERFDLVRSPNDSAAASAMAELLGNYEDGLDTPVDFGAWRESQQSKRASKRHQTLASRWVIGGAIAALIAVVGLLAVVLLDGDASDEQFADESVDRDSEPRERVVARLTDVLDAKWAEGAFASGSDLRVGQRLTLTQGFAELTTKDGAIAILEAPATVELIDNNALHLHAGKLVGICETQSSKGFLVRTVNAEIVDLGTEFGVEIMADGSTQALVFSGQIVLREVSEVPNQVTSSVRLTEGWSSRINHQGRIDQAAVPLSAELASRFVTSINHAAAADQPYRRMVLASDPIVYWGFDEREDTTANLAGQNAWSGKAFGQSDHDQGLFGAGLKLTGEIESMGGFKSAEPLNFDKLESYTLEVWYRADRPQIGRVLGLDHIDPTAQLPPKTLSMIELSDDPHVSGGGKEIRFVHRNPISNRLGDGKDIFSDQPTPIGQWVHVVAVKDGNALRLYVNGALVREAEDAQPVATNRPLTLCVGVSAYAITPDATQRADEFRPFAGTIDELAIYDSALTEQTIQAHFRSGRSDQTGPASP